jgi:hypothetical protein
MNIIKYLTFVISLVLISGAGKADVIGYAVPKKAILCPMTLERSEPKITIKEMTRVTAHSEAPLWAILEPSKKGNVGFFAIDLNNIVRKFDQSSFDFLATKDIENVEVNFLAGSDSVIPIRGQIGDFYLHDTEFRGEYAIVRISKSQVYLVTKERADEIDRLFSDVQKFAKSFNYTTVSIDVNATEEYDRHENKTKHAQLLFYRELRDEEKHYIKHKDADIRQILSEIRSNISEIRYNLKQEKYKRDLIAYEAQELERKAKQKIENERYAAEAAAAEKLARERALSQYWSSRPPVGSQGSNPYQSPAARAEAERFLKSYGQPASQSDVQKLLDINEAIERNK